MSGQLLWGPPAASITDVLRHFGAVQAQEFLPAKWSLAQRVEGATDADVHAAFADGTVLRTHILRPTWHFVHADDIRWMLLASAPRVHAANASQYRQIGVADEVVLRSQAVFEDVLADGVPRKRTELARALAAAGLSVSGTPLAYVIMRAELDGVLISGAEKDSYTLLDLRVPGAATIDRDAAVVSLVQRYFAGHGPATLKDFATWASFTITETRQALDALGDTVVSEEIDGRTYWSVPGSGNTPARPASPDITLLQDYDEYIVGYFDSRGVNMHPDGPDAALGPRVRALLLDGQVIGHWKHAIRNGRAEVTTLMSRAFTKPEAASLHRAVQRFGEFLGVPAELV